MNSPGGKIALLTALILMSWIGFKPAAVAGQQMLRPQTPLIRLVDWGKENHTLPPFDAARSGDAIFTLFQEPDGNYRMLELDAACRTLQAVPLSLAPAVTPGVSAPLVFWDRQLVILDGQRDLRLTTVVDGHPVTDLLPLVEVLGKGTFEERAAIIYDSVLQVVIAFRPDANRQHRILYSLEIDPVSRSQPKIAVLSDDARLNKLRSKLSVQAVDQAILALVARTPLSGPAQLDLFVREADSTVWSREAIEGGAPGGASAVHVTSGGTLLFQGAHGGLSGRTWDKSGGELQTYSKSAPRLIDSDGDIVVWADNQRHGTRWWGHIPGYVLFSPNDSPDWDNNNLFTNLTQPQVLTPDPGQVGDARVFQLADHVVVTWVGYESFQGGAEQREIQPLRLFCQSFTR